MKKSKGLKLKLKKLSKKLDLPVSDQMSDEEDVRIEAPSLVDVQHAQVEAYNLLNEEHMRTLRHEIHGTGLTLRALWDSRAVVLHINQYMGEEPRSAEIDQMIKYEITKYRELIRSYLSLTETAFTPVVVPATEVVAAPEDVEPEEVTNGGNGFTEGDNNFDLNLNPPA